jgi:hypothetical protein
MFIEIQVDGYPNPPDSPHWLLGQDRLARVAAGT